MKHIRRNKLLFLLFAVSESCVVTLVARESCNTPCSVSKTTWLPRSFSSYSSVRDLLEEEQVFNMYACQTDDYHLNISFSTEYMQNFGAKCNNSCKNLGALPFWSGTNTMTIGNNDGRANLDAYQFGLGNVEVNEDGIAGVIQLNPQVQHFGTDMMLYYAQKNDEPGLFFKLHAPLGALRMTPHLKELVVAHPDDQISFTQTTSGASSSVIYYEFEQYPAPDRRQQTISQAFYGGVVSGDVLGGNLNQPINLRKARIAPETQTAIRLGDITASLGYNFIVRDKSMLGAAFKVSCPTGNVPTADYTLEPIFGRAGLWGVGAELSGLYVAWENQAGDRDITIGVQGELLHLVPGRTPNFRTFDLKQNGPGSKYLLVQNYVAVYNFGSATNPPTFRATETYVPSSAIGQASGITTIPVISKIGVEGSFAVQVDYNCKHWSMGIGGEVWGRTREELAIDFVSAVDFRLPSLNDFAVLGRQVSQYQVDGQPGTANPVQTYYCEPLATISTSQEPVILVGSVTVGPDYVTAPATLPSGIADATIASNRIPANVCEALDIQGAQASAVCTGRLFGHAGYTWAEHKHTPSVSLLGSLEFTNTTNNAVQMWSVGLFGSLNF